VWLSLVDGHQEWSTLEGVAMDVERRLAVRGLSLADRESLLMIT
jgi:hypothetical protein